MDTEELEDLDPLHYSPINVDGGALGPPFPGIHKQLLCLVEGEVVVLAPHSQVTDLPPNRLSHRHRWSGQPPLCLQQN